MSDPQSVVDALDDAHDAFEFRHGADFEAGIDQSDDWRTQLTKACRYLAACRTLRNHDGYNGAVVELCFGAIERSLEAYLLRETADTLTDFRDHETVYRRASDCGLLSAETTAELRALYDDNRSQHYYGAASPTQQKETAMMELARAVHDHTAEWVRSGDVCRCGSGV